MNKKDWLILILVIVSTIDSIILTDQSNKTIEKQQSVLKAQDLFIDEQNEIINDLKLDNEQLKEALERNYLHYINNNWCVGK